MRTALAVAMVGAALIGPRSQQPGRDAATVALVRLPDGGIQPQAVADSRGAIHVVYFKGEPGAGDLFYARLAVDGVWSDPLRVNSVPASAIATGGVRGAQLAVDGAGRPHVAWNGSAKATPLAPGGATPMLYTRLNDVRTAFEPQRNLIQSATGLDGGGAIAADDKGRVFVAWHAGGPASKGEGDRRVWVAASRDGGRTFSAELAASDPSEGACGCCGMDAAIDRAGTLYLLFRSARDRVHRVSFVLTSTDGAKTFSSANLQEWTIDACPMSTFSLAESSSGMLAAWETAGQVQYARVTNGAATSPIEPEGDVRTRRHPSLAVNAAGATLLAWTEGTGWQRGGGLAWATFDRNGQRVGEFGRVSGVPVWGLIAAVPRGDGRFFIIY